MPDGGRGGQSGQELLDKIPGAPEVFAEIADTASKCKDRLADFFLEVDVAESGTLVQSAENKKAKNPRYLTNLVMQGGGVLGLAHVGFIAGLEAAGIRFAGVAGTSAGAIAATGLVCARGENLNTVTSSKLYELVSSMPMGDFVDGPMASRMLIKHWVAKKSLASLGYGLMAFATFRRILKLRGLNPGQTFETWLGLALGRLGIATSADLLDLMKSVHHTLIAAGVKFSKPIAEGQSLEENDTAHQHKNLSVIASAMPSGVKFRFPEDLSLLKSDYLNQSPAVFVRASMSIPGFFEPKRLYADKENWQKRLNDEFDEIASESQIRDFEEAQPIGFLDGGIFSNLPFDSFKHIANVPTVVLTLVEKSDRQDLSAKSNAKGLLKDLGRTFDAIRLQRDRDAIYLARYEKNLEVIGVDTTGFNWLDFAMSKTDRDKLFMRGLSRAAKFLELLGTKEGIRR